MKEIKDFILNLLQIEGNLDSAENLDNIDYVEEGYVTSLGLIQFMVELEEKYNIRFTDEEMWSDDFKIIGNLVKMIEGKLM